VMVDTEPGTGNVRTDVLRVLARYRRGDQLHPALGAKSSEVYFGQNMVPNSEGQVSVGDRVQVQSYVGPR
jgi:uncharacterized protein YcbX